MRVRYTLRAQADLDAIYTYLDTRAPAAAQSVKSVIERRIALLADFPHMAPETDVPGVYELTAVRLSLFQFLHCDAKRLLHSRQLYFDFTGGVYRLLRGQNFSLLAIEDNTVCRDRVCGSSHVAGERRLKVGTPTESEAIPPLVEKANLGRITLYDIARAPMIAFKSRLGPVQLDWQEMTNVSK